MMPLPNILYCDVSSLKYYKLKLMVEENGEMGEVKDRLPES